MSPAARWGREGALFLLVSLVACGLVFGRAMWGQTLLAPVDIAPALWAHFRYVDPDSNGVPRNHHIVDQLSYDLPAQWTIYHAYRRGEIPWWDPYTLGGRPLLADAHANGTDPVRVLTYLVLPRFELAYNWTRILHSLLGGLGLFVLLRRFGTSALVAGGCALAGQFAGWTSIYFGHPWVQASFVWYSWLWVCWHRAWEEGSVVRRVLPALLVAAIFFAGNLQSHVYLVLFSLAFLAGYSGLLFKAQRLRREHGDAQERVPPRWWGLLAIAPALVLGGLLAVPVLLPQLELFLLRDRELAGVTPWKWWSGAVPFFSLHPWALGTFRTLDFVKLYNQGSYGFVLYLGTAAMLLSGFGGWGKTHTAPQRTALWLLGIYLAVFATPLLELLYGRTAGLGALALVVLAARGFERLRKSTTSFPRTAAALVAFACGIAAASHVIAWAIFPRVREPLHRIMNARLEVDETGGLSARLRAFQVENLPHEISFANPEVLGACLGMLLLAAHFYWVPLRSSRRVQLALLALNLAPLLLFAHRFIPRASLEQWHRFAAGSEEQRRVAAALGEKSTRLSDEAPGHYAELFPMNYAQLHRIHRLQGYAALQPRAQIWHPNADPTKVADFRYTATAVPGTGEWQTIHPHSAARFSWEGGDVRSIAVRRESLNTLELAFPSGPAALLRRTDTFYPGWRAFDAAGRELPLQQLAAVHSQIEVPAGTERVALRYQPRWLLPGAVAAGFAAAVIVGAILGAWRIGKSARAIVRAR